MNAVRKENGSVKPRTRKPAPERLHERSLQPASAVTVCRRCGTAGPVGDDGFCEKCEKALEQACL